MLTSLDHVRIRALDVEQAIGDYEQLLGDGLRAPDGSVQLGTTGLEFVEAEDGALAGELGEGVAALVFTTDSLDELGDLLALRGIGAMRDGARLTLAAEATRGVALEVVEAPPRAPRANGSSDAGERLDHAVVITQEHDAAIALYRDVLGLRLALDKTFEERGVRILFFRLAGVTVEVAGPIDAPREGDASLSLDRFGGLAWRGRDVVAWSARLLNAGFKVSEHRKGHKPGTRVCSVGDRTAGVPTLLIGDDSSGQGS